MSSRASLRAPLGIAIIAAALAVLLLAAAPRANATPYGFKGEDKIRERGTCPNGACEQAYLGPTYLVKPGTTNSDAYYCPSPYSALTSWAVLPEDDSAELGYSVYSFNDTGGPSSFSIKTHNWGLKHTFRARAMWTCTNNTSVYATIKQDWATKLIGIFSEPIRRALGRAPQWANEVLDILWKVVVGRPQLARADGGAHSFPLHDGANTIALGYSGASRNLPPAFYLSTVPADANCLARQMLAPSFDDQGAVQVRLFCRDLGADGATARLQVGKPLVRTFPLHDGEGAIDVTLDKPPGAIAPFVRLSAKGEPNCTARRVRLDVGEREVHLRLDGDCEDAAGASGRLYVGGLLAP
jgi:hypothetical protein